MFIAKILEMGKAKVIGKAIVTDCGEITEVKLFENSRNFPKQKLFNYKGVVYGIFKSKKEQVPIRLYDWESIRA